MLRCDIEKRTFRLTGTKKETNRKFGRKLKPWSRPMTNPKVTLVREGSLIITGRRR